ncbi:MAG: hypothetical protein OXD49_06925 [Candidatus Poribacteria bacterium]|nr:hypothetical protein [Candidatus Poribacteria bacterium]
MHDIYIEISTGQPPGSDGFTEGLVHRYSACEFISNPDAVYLCYDTDLDFYSVKVEPGKCCKVDKYSKCPSCFGLDAEHYDRYL